MNKNVIVCLILALCLAVPAIAEIDFSGMVIAEFYDQELNGTNYGGLDVTNARPFGASVRGTNPSTFDLSVIELDMDADLTEKISSRVDLELESRYGAGSVRGTGNQVYVEQAYIKIAEIFDWPVDIVVGKFNAPWGVEPEEEYDLKLVSHSIVNEWTDIGNLTGVAISGGVSFVDYVVWAANGVHPALNSVTAGQEAILTTANTAVVGGNAVAIVGGPYQGITTAGAAARTRQDIDFNGDDQNFALGFRIGVAPEIIEGFEAGISFVVDTVDPRSKYLVADWNNYAVNPTTGLLDQSITERLQMYDVDVSYQTGPFEFKFEYIDGRVRINDQPSIPVAAAIFRPNQEMNVRGYSFQGAYDVSDRLTLVGRYGYYDQDRKASIKEDREEMTVGVNYKVADGVVTKLEYRLNDESLGLQPRTLAATDQNIQRGSNPDYTLNPDETDNNSIAAQLAVSF